jgi:antitoxin ParD1/3/4
MPGRNVNLTDHYASFIDECLASGEFNNASEVVRAGLQLLEQRLKENRARIEYIRRRAAGRR